jgi:hypothetical protein
MWIKAIPQVDREWLEKTDHFLMNAEEIPDENSYVTSEGHVNVRAMRIIYKWIRAHWADA